MANYNVQNESARILLENILSDDRLGWTPETKEACRNVKFVGDSKPFIPTPLKITESASSLSGLLGALAATVAEERYGVKQDVTINTDKATLFLMGILLPTIHGESFIHSKAIGDALAECDMYKMTKPIHQQLTNIYQCRDKKWFHLHGSMNATHCMRMVGVPEQDVTHKEAQAIYAEKVAQWDSEEIDRTANDEFKQAGCICNTVEEFWAHPHTKILEKEPMVTLVPHTAPKKPWPSVGGTDYRPLAGIRVVDHTRAVAGPTVSKLLAVLGADVIKVSYTGIPDTSVCLLDINTGKRDVDINLKTEEGKAVLRKIIEGADVFIDGYRPHSIAKLGFDADSVRKVNPSLIYVRENCYGWKGPLSYRTGWQQIADCFAGLSWMQGEFLGLDEPVVPLLPNSDYQTGIIGAASVVQALQKRANSDTTFDIDISIIQYNIWYYRLGQYTQDQGKAILARNPSFEARHFDEMGSMFAKMVVAVNESRPGLLQNPEFYTKMSGKNWNEDRDISILGAPFTLSKSKVDYLTPSGPRGWSNNNYEWN
ncbi:Succinyl-CoA--L-malate CoA-transferase alpha subunit [Lachnellula arida]|uniref:Succinyl-CoA--L-malate CoA-transferase alpha subunit n=1 Tax=Lachnellula arida TaxID=1316785 RepID=A0A8T9BL16_9HELO|nr:Succinyl-CoA--L-malate CoA-transferase alpha subunit [Lachnellula arida]